LLVDYREQRSNHDETDNPVYPFPIETGESLFQKVESSFSINGNTTNLIASFPSLTTKYGPYWSTYKDYPANFYIHDGNKDSYSINHNKRFLGYLRPEKEAKKLQIINTEDVRAFYNNSYLKGSIYVNSNRSFDSTPIINLSAYNSGLLQIDQSAEYLLNMSLAVFLSNVSNPENFIKDGTTSNSKLDDDGYKYVSDKDGWNVLKSEQTYILKNKPSFMGSFIAETTSGDPKQLTINSASMLFSRDRAKPVLYLAGNKYIWTLYKNSLLKNISSENIIKSNLAISEDGQKLLFTKQNDSIASISVYNISNLDETLFIDSTVTSDKILSKQLNAKATTFSTSYLTEMSEMKFNYPNSLTNLATKPFLSYKSSNGGGEYIKLVDDYPFIISNNSAAVASGGIYIIGSDTRKIILFNPTIKRNEAYLLSNHLIKAANSAVIAAYNDTLYTFGNAKVSNEDLGGRVQSFNVNTGEARTSRRESDTYMASRYYDSTSDDYVKISVSSEYSGYSEKENAFKTGTSGDWNTNSQLNGHINYSFEKSSIKQPFVVNKIVIDNSSDYNGNSSRSNATKDYKFVGRNGADEFVLCEGTLEKNK
ncbi:MAG: hypothetical protein J6Z11_02250, partial [Candidatus Riflebacteria bacterium]|nr:hypothetical protein [Candidatus Riflebacteria bacterium]